VAQQVNDLVQQVVASAQKESAPATEQPAPE
jgi:hypothetical protein